MILLRIPFIANLFLAIRPFAAVALATTPEPLAPLLGPRMQKRGLYPVGGRQDIIKISSKGVRDPDPKYHPDIPPPDFNHHDYEEGTKRPLDFPAREYKKNALDDPKATCLARLCGHVVPAICHRTNRFGHKWQNPGVWYEQRLEQTGCEFKRLGQTLEAAYDGPDEGNKHMCVRK